MDFHQSENWGKFLESLGWQTEVVDGCALRIRKLGPLGSIIKIQRPDFLPMEKINSAAKKHRALFVKIEPINNSQLSILNSQFYKPDSWPLTATRTLEIDLTQTEDELWKGLSKDARQSIKKVQSSNVKISTIDFSSLNPYYHTTVRGNKEGQEKYLQDFYKIWKETGTRGKFWVPPYKELLEKVKAFGENTLLILASTTNKNDEIEETDPERPPLQHPDPTSGHDNGATERSVSLSGCLLLFCDGVAYYHHAGSTIGGQKLEAPYLVMWQAILESKKKEMKKLDLEGIFDPRFRFMNTRAWHNFSTFKLKWDGQVVDYPGAYTRVYHPLVKILFWLEKFSDR